jgi:hypothetical protein
VKYLEAVSTRREESPCSTPLSVDAGVNVKYLEAVSTRREESPCSTPLSVDAGVNVKYLEVVSTRREESPVLPLLRSDHLLVNVFHSYPQHPSYLASNLLFRLTI